MAEAARGGLHLVDGAVLNGGDGRTGSLLALRVARPVVDKLDRRDRARIAALVACVPDADPHAGRCVARLAVGGLSLTSSLALHVSGCSAIGLFTALHVARAVQRGGEGAMVLLISLDANRSGAVLLGAQGPTLCRPLPPVGAERAPPDGDAEPAHGAGLAQALARGGVHAGTIDHAISPGVPVEAATRAQRSAGLGCTSTASAGDRIASLEEAFARAAVRPPEGRTLLWGHDRDGRIGACVLEPA